MTKEKNNYKFGLLLALISIILISILGPLGVIYTILRALIKLTLKELLNVLSRFFWFVAYSLDQLGNVLCQYLFNDVLILPEGYKFGNPDETISGVLGKNKAEGTLRRPGKLLADLLNRIDPEHVEKAANSE